MTQALTFKSAAVRRLLAEAEREPDPRLAVELRIQADKVRTEEIEANHAARRERAT